MSKYILFYSIRCRHCEKFQQVLSNYPEINADFQKVALESLQKIPVGLSVVPTVLEKETGNILSGQQVFDWIETRIKNGFVAGPNISSKHGIEDAQFSFIGTSESEYNDKYTILGKEGDTGSNINPRDFDSRTGLPIKKADDRMSEQEFKRYNERMTNKDMPTIPVEQAYLMAQNRDASFMNNQMMQHKNAPLPDHMRPVDVTKAPQGPSMDDIMSRRNAEIGMPQRRMM